MKNINFARLLFMSVFALLSLFAFTVSPDAGIAMSVGPIAVNHYSSALAKFKNYLTEMGINAAAAIITRTTLKVDNVLVNGQGNYTFDFEYRGGQATNDEFKLEREEMFCVAGIGLGVTATANGGQGNNPTLYSADAFPAADQVGIRPLHKGELVLKTDNSDRTVEIQTSDLEYYEGAGIINSPDQYQPLIRPLVFNGDVKNQAILTLNSGALGAIGGAAAGDRVVSVLLHGFHYDGQDPVADKAACSTNL